MSGKLRSIYPKHVAIIMDGNGRWATKRGYARVEGHKAGVQAVYRTVTYALNIKLPILTLYAFSSENWNRPQQEVKCLMELFECLLKSNAEFFQSSEIRLKFIGNTNKLPASLKEKIKKVEEMTSNNNRMRLNVAANYGGRWDIVQAVQNILTQVKEKNIDPAKINEDLISEYLSLSGQSEVDLLIRTGGECRLSNFLLWQIAYTELFFTDVLWPDFDELMFEEALKSFSLRERRFGCVN